MLAMRDELIAAVTMDDAGRLLLRPAKTMFDDLHMAGAWGFRWDVATRSLAIPRPSEWSYRDWFDHVVTIIRQQYGVHLKLSPQTQWASVPSTVQEEIQASSA